MKLLLFKQNFKLYSALVMRQENNQFMLIFYLTLFVPFLRANLEKNVFKNKTNARFIVKSNKAAPSLVLKKYIFLKLKSSFQVNVWYALQCRSRLFQLQI